MRPKCSLLLPLSRVTRTKRPRFQSRLYAKTSNTACNSMKIFNIIFADADADADADANLARKFILQIIPLSQCEMFITNCFY